MIDIAAIVWSWPAERRERWEVLVSKFVGDGRSRSEAERWAYELTKEEPKPRAIAAELPGAW